MVQIKNLTMVITTGLPAAKISTLLLLLLVLSAPTIMAFQVSLKSKSTLATTSNTQPISTTNIYIPSATTSVLSIRHSSSSSSTSQLTASKNNKTNRRGEGFGNIPTSTKDTSGSIKTASTAASDSSDRLYKESLPKITTAATASSVEKNNNIDNIAINNDIPVQERTASILREQYGLRTIEEQQMDAKQLKLYKEQQKEVSEWKKRVLSTNDGNGDIDILSLIPGPIVIGIDRTLKVGLALSSIAFIISGILVTLEAYTKATSSELLPLYLKEFVVNVIQPNFTIGLGIVLTFSILLGLLATAQLSSTNASYRE